MSGPGVTMGEALAAFRGRHGQALTAAGGRILIIKVGPLKLPMINPGYLDLHDLHHVILDVPPTILGEAEVSAFELRTGCPSWLVAFICTSSLVVAFFVSPRRALAAWRRFKGYPKNLYGEGARFHEILAEPVTSVREQILRGESA
jgi:hypothetical protein